MCQYKTESITNNHNNRKFNLQTKISTTTDPNILLMRTSELDRAERVYNEKIEELNRATQKADIHTARIVCGVIIVKGK